MILRLSILTLSALFFACDATGEVQHPATISVKGQRRDYILVTPSARPAEPRPLVLLLHGHIGSAANALGEGFVPSPLSAWLRIAEREKIYVAALQGLKGADGRTGWHDCRNDALSNPRSDDVAFAAKVVRNLISDGRADADRIYVMGMSNGATMSYRLALEMKPRPAAIAAVSGTMALHSACTADAHPVSVLIIHGTDDPIAPYDGGVVRLIGSNSGSITSAEATRDFWLRVDGLRNTAPTRYTFPHLSSDGTSAVKTIYGEDDGPQIELLTIERGGHIEPSLRFQYGPVLRSLVGAQSRDLESAEEAWRFFRTKTAIHETGTS